MEHYDCLKQTFNQQIQLRTGADVNAENSSTSPAVRQDYSSVPSLGMEFQILGKRGCHCEAKQKKKHLFWSIDATDFLEDVLYIPIEIENPVTRQKKLANAIIDIGSNRTGIHSSIVSELQLEQISEIVVEGFQGSVPYSLFKGILHIPDISFVDSCTLIGLSVEEVDAVIGRNVLSECALSFYGSTGRASLYSRLNNRSSPIRIP